MFNLFKNVKRNVKHLSLIRGNIIVKQMSPSNGHLEEINSAKFFFFLIGFSFSFFFFFKSFCCAPP